MLALLTNSQREFIFEPDVWGRHCCYACEHQAAEKEPVPMAERQERVFVLRFWRECSQREEPWRGRALEIGAGASISASAIDDVTDFVKLRLAEETPLKQ